jgi:hypothetical protein
MKPRLINALVLTSGTLSGASLLIWIASYALGLFVLRFSPNNGYSFISTQRGTLAFCFGDAPSGAQSHVWWLQPDEMFDNQNQQVNGQRLIMLPDEGGPRFTLGSQHYPWRWSISSGFEGFIPIWTFPLFFAIAPVAWAAGIFDRTSQASQTAGSQDRNDPTN